MDDDKPTAEEKADEKIDTDEAVEPGKIEEESTVSNDSDKINIKGTLKKRLLTGSLKVTEEKTEIDSTKANDSAEAQ